MRLARFLIVMVILTAIALVYIQLQVQIFDLAYQGKNKEVEILRLMDNNGDVHQDISTLRSANHLGIKVLADNSDMQFLSNEQIVRLEMPIQSIERESIALSSKNPRKLNFLANIFSLKSQAEARTIK